MDFAPDNEIEDAVDLTEEDLNDPELLRELQLLSSEQESAERSSQPSQNNDHAKLEELMSLVEKDAAELKIDDLTEQLAAMTIPSLSLDASSTQLPQNQKPSKTLGQKDSQKDFAKAVSRSSSTPVSDSASRIFTSKTGLEESHLEGKNKITPTLSSSLKSPESRSVTPLQQNLESLRQQLQSQIDICKSLAITYMKSGDKSLALTFHKLHKLFSTDILLLSSEKTLAETRVNSVMVRYQYHNVNWDIEVNDIRIKIIRGYFGVSGEYYVTFTTQSGANTTGEFVIQGTTSSSKKCLDPEWNHVSNFTMPGPSIKTPTSAKQHVRFADRKKLTVEVFQTKGFFPFRKSESVGKCLVKLGPLQTQAVIHETLDLMYPESGKRPTGGKIEIEISVREALSEKEFVDNREKWIVLGDYDRELFKDIGPESIPPIPQPIKSKDTLMQAAAITKDKVSVPAKPSSVKKVVVSSDDETVILFESNEALVSNNVIEAELEVINKRLSGQLPPNESSALQERKEQLEFSLRFLSIQVQTGQLTLDVYVQQVKKCIDLHKRMALEFKKKGYLDHAKRALARIKIMTEEVTEVPQEESVSGN